MPVAELLFGHGAVHGLDGAAHQDRKRLFLDLLGEDRIAGLADEVGRALRVRAEAWRGRDVVVFRELTEVYAAGVLAWAGIDCSPEQARRIGHRMAAIVDGFGLTPGAYPRAWTERLRGNAWARRLIRRAAVGSSTAATERPPVPALAGRLDVRTAAVELINIVRPTVAVAWPGTFAALALAEHPRWRPLLREEGDDPVAGVDRSARCRVAFGHEVRRHYPFVPALAGRARRSVEIGGVVVRRGDRLVLDVVGTDHDPKLWAEPDEFRPERFLDGTDLEPDPFDFVPQGGGDPSSGHRCPGEPLTVRLLAATVEVLAEVDYEVVSPASYDRRRIPTLPAGGLIVRVR